MIYTPGQKIKKELVEIQHVDYARLAKKAQFWRHCYDGTGGYALTLLRMYRDGSTSMDMHADDDDKISYVDRFVRESKDAYERRVQAASYHNFLREAVIDILVGYICKQAPDRKHYPDWAKDWVEDVTKDGKSLNDLIKDTVLPYGFIYGRLAVKVDSDYTPDAQTQAERTARGARDVYLDVIHPDAIVHWHRDAEQRYEWMKYRVQVETAQPLTQVTRSKRYVWLTNEGWWMCDEPTEGADWPVTGGDVWGGAAGRVVFPESLPPVTEVVIGDGQSYMEDLGPLCKLLFNLQSELRTLERGACFPIMLWPRSGEQGDASITAGVLNALSYDDMQQHAPELLEFQGGPFEHYLARLDAEIGRLKEIGGTSTFFGAQRETAAALLVKFGNTDRKLANLAKSLEEWEERTLKVVAAWKGERYEEQELRPRYPRTFEAMDLERLEKGLETMDVVGAPRELMAEVLHKITNTLFPNADSQTQEKFDAALKRWEQGDGADARTRELASDDTATPDVPDLPDAQAE